MGGIEKQSKNGELIWFVANYPIERVRAVELT
jgi:hypothetical protein